MLIGMTGKANTRKTSTTSTAKPLSFSDLVGSARPSGALEPGHEKLLRQRNESRLAQRHPAVLAAIRANPFVTIPEDATVAIDVMSDHAVTFRSGDSVYQARYIFDTGNGNVTLYMPQPAGRNA
jgi:hypothetical protein